MASRSGRRSRTLESDDETSRPNTPSSTAPNDSKRQRRRNPSTRPGDSDGDDNNDDGSDNDDVNDNEEFGMASGLTTASQSLAQTHTRNTQTPSMTHPQLNGQSSHQPGAIVRVKLVNFVTYTWAEFFPGPNLNMVIGPNGTGKSTLVCAICLGLGWGPQFLGRAKEVGEFVKHGCREATIEIELQRQDGARRNPVVTRIIKREGNKSVYTLNGNASTAKAIQAMANTFNIQIDNLCQFLPQDKVVEFAQMSPIELLASTQRAVATPDMMRKHEELKTLRKAQTELLTELRNSQDRLKNLESRQDMQRNEVERMKERAAVKKKLDWLEKGRCLVEFQEVREQVKQAKQRMIDLSREVRELKEAEQPTLRKLDAKKHYLLRANTFKKLRDRETTAKESRCEVLRKDIETKQTIVEDAERKIEAEKKSLPDLRNQLSRKKQSIERCKKQREQEPEKFDAKEMTSKSDGLKAESRALEREKANLETQMEGLRRQRDERNRLNDVYNEQLRQLETQAGQQERKLQSMSKDAFEAWKWLEKSQDLFQQHVYGPPIIECSLKDPSLANAVESIMRDSDFKIFTAQNPADFKLLQQKLLHEMKLHDISLREAHYENIDGFRRPLSPEELQRLGLTGWAIDLLEGPSSVLGMLCEERHLHQSPIGPKDLTNEQHQTLSASSVRNYVAGNKACQFVRRPEYGAAGSTAHVRDIRSARAWSTQAVNQGEKAEIQKKIDELNSDHADIKNEAREIKASMEQTTAKITQLREEIQQINLEKDAKQKALMVWRGLEPKLRTLEEDASNLQAQLDGSKVRRDGLVAERDAALLEKAEAVVKFAAALGELKLTIKHRLEAEVMAIEAKSDYEVLKVKNDHIVQGIQQKRDEEATAEQTWQQFMRRVKPLQAQVKKAAAEAEAIAENEEDQEPRKILHDILENCKEMADLEAIIDSENAKLELTEGGHAGIITEFEERAQSIEKLRTKLQEATTRQEDFNHSIREIRGTWEPRLMQLVSKINDAFSDSFARIGCAGQVAIHKASSELEADCAEENGGPENGLDFANWAIHISVKFRESERLSLLDSHRQSGGERAVSTIFYLMALQSLSRAPFRVVDEINQGMDPRNERMVHGRMVDIAANDGGSQYFLITPKLLSGLKYRRGMTILCIVSGENMPAAKELDEGGNWVENPKIDFRTFVKKAQAMGLGTNVAGRRIDPGMHLSPSFRTLSQISGVGA